MPEKFEFVAIREDDKVAGDRRRAPRASCEYTVEFVDPGTGSTIRGTVLDISLVGMRIHTMGAVRLREPDNVRFYVWINGSLLKLSGAIVRQTTNADLGVAFKAEGAILRDRIDHHVQEAARRNLKLEKRRRVVAEAPPPPEQESMRSVARSFMKGGNGLHESMEAARSRGQSVSRKWLDRRIATHLDG